MEEDANHIQIVLERFFAGIATAEMQALLLDYDGTLAPFHVDPASALPYPGIREALHVIQGCNRSKIILVSGRRAQDVSTLLGVEGIEIWGCHGMEHLSKSGILQQPSLDSKTAAALKHTFDLLVGSGLAEFIEQKPTGHAVHWRGMAAKQAEQIRLATEATWADTVEKDVLRILRFDGGIEICAAAMNKGNVVRQIANTLGERYAIAYLGDDVTDEDAFQALKGIGLSVLVRDAYRDTGANVWIRPPKGVIEFLERWAKACQRQP